MVGVRIRVFEVKEPIFVYMFGIDTGHTNPRWLSYNVKKYLKFLLMNVSRIVILLGFVSNRHMNPNLRF